MEDRISKPLPILFCARLFANKLERTIKLLILWSLILRMQLLLSTFLLVVSILLKNMIILEQIEDIKALELPNPVLMFPLSADWFASL